jgi:hypothetical protein
MSERRSPFRVLILTGVDSPSTRAGVERVVRVRIWSFAYPFGRRANVRPAMVHEVHAAGYELLQSAYDGVNVGRRDPSNVLPVGISDRFDRWALLAEIAGISPQGIRQRWAVPGRAALPESDLGSGRLRV